MSIMYIYHHVTWHSNRTEILRTWVQPRRRPSIDCAGQGK